MVFLNNVLCLLTFGIVTSGVMADTNCLGGPAFGLEAACDFQNFDGLNGHPASEILYQILMQSPLDNNTFFANESHVTCLFRDTRFVLDGFGAGAGPISFQLGGITIPGTLCVFPTGVEEGGLRLGEIRELARVLIDENGGDCHKCGRISVNHISGNESREGYLEFDWDSNASCRDNCIDPARAITPSATPTPTAQPSSARKRWVGAWEFQSGLTSVLLFGASLSFGMFVMM